MYPDPNKQNRKPILRHKAGEWFSTSSGQEIYVTNKKQESF